MKIKNVTTAKTQQGNNVKPQFKIRHIWINDETDPTKLYALINTAISSDKVPLWKIIFGYSSINFPMTGFFLFSEHIYIFLNFLLSIILL